MPGQRNGLVSAVSSAIRRRAIEKRRSGRCEAPRCEARPIVGSRQRLSARRNPEHAC